MADMSKIDKNFAVQTSIEKDDIKFYNIEEKPFKVYGVYKEDGKYRRLPEDVAKNTSDGVFMLSTNTAGGRVRFVTDSSYIAIHAEVFPYKMPHFAFTGSIGFDLYIGNDYKKSFIPPVEVEDKFESVAELETNELREITINFPLYSDVINLYVGLQEGAIIKEASPYINEKPVVFYGSSITQGGCASRPGTSYQGFLSRKFNFDYINLGFSGCAKAEDAIIEYIKNLDMSVFVYDYDHNAPSVEHLKNTHEKMFNAIREKHPDLPIVMMSRPKFYLVPTEKERLEIIETTYKNALKKGDKNVYLVTGKELTAFCGNEGTVDSCHPTDFGFFSMAKALEPVFENIKLI